MKFAVFSNVGIVLTLYEFHRCNIGWFYGSLLSSPGGKKLSLRLYSEDQLNINITNTFIDLYKNVKSNWTEDYYSLSNKDRWVAKKSQILISNYCTDKHNL